MRASPVFPSRRLPPGFLSTLQNPPDPPATPRPSATLVPIRQGEDGLEVLLLQRSPRSGFIPGAWVFPGGTLDEEDGGGGILRRFVPPGSGDQSPAHRGPEADPKQFPGLEPPLPFWVAAVRETFEETGILLCRPDDSGPLDPLSPYDPALDPGRQEQARTALLEDEATFSEVLESLKVTLDASGLVYTAHWVTPECEPRRYETRFFMAAISPGARVEPHEPEMVAALWLSPTEALARNHSGDLPMVLPTVSALEELIPFTSVTQALEAQKGKTISRCLPVPEQTPTGVRFLLPW